MKRRHFVSVLDATLRLIIGALIAVGCQIPPAPTQSPNPPSATESPPSATQAPTSSPAPTAAPSSPPPTLPPPSGVWLIDATLSERIPPPLAAQIAALIVAPDTGDRFELNAIAVADGWAFGTAQAASDDVGDPIASEYAVLIAHETNSDWEITTDRSTADFCRLLAAAPAPVVDSNMRAFFLGCQ